MKHLAKLGTFRCSESLKRDLWFALWAVGLIGVALGTIVLSTLVSGQWLLIRF